MYINLCLPWIVKINAIFMFQPCAIWTYTARQSYKLFFIFKLQRCLENKENILYRVGSAMMCTLQWIFIFQLWPICSRVRSEAIWTQLPLATFSFSGIFQTNQIKGKSPVCRKSEAWRYTIICRKKSWMDSIITRYSQINVSWRVQYLS